MTTADDVYKSIARNLSPAQCRMLRDLDLELVSAQRANPYDRTMKALQIRGLVEFNWRPNARIIWKLTPHARQVLRFVVFVRNTEQEAVGRYVEDRLGSIRLGARRAPKRFRL